MANLSASNRRYRLLFGIALVLASLPYVLGGTKFDDTITARLVRTEAISIMRDGKLLASLGTTSGGLSHREGAFLELCDGQQRSLISLRANDPYGPGITIRNQTPAGVFPVLRMGATSRGDAELIAANKAGKMVAQIGVDPAGRGSVSVLDDRSANGLAGFLSGSSLNPLRQVALLGADSGGSGSLGICDVSGKPMVSLGVSNGLNALAPTARMAPVLRQEKLSGKLTVQNQSGAVLFKAP